MKRRQFLLSAGIISLGLIASTKVKAASLIKHIAEVGNDFKERILAIIKELKTEGSNLVKKIMNGKKYEYDPYTHYPYDGGIKDEKTGYQLFFHIHRPNEYGHFHTFATDENGDLVHLVLISMDEQGKPIALATVNRWVTGDKYVKADELKNLSKDFYVNPSLFTDPKVVEFINDIFKAYDEEIFQLYDERDRWIKDYVNNNFREPFEDREFEILSERKSMCFRK
ncbi:MAG: hypothetical protein U5J96_16240 [Ignavibacteriaceae bacterium]|nr:hypothetical protein [Ignavibacteriaceae bacterium]